MKKDKKGNQPTETQNTKKEGQGWEAKWNEETKRYEAMVFECSREGFMRDEFIISKDMFDQLGGNDKLAWELIKSGDHLSYFENSIHGPDIERHYK